MQVFCTSVLLRCDRGSRFGISFSSASLDSASGVFILQTTRHQNRRPESDALGTYSRTCTHAGQCGATTALWPARAYAV